MSTRTIGYVKQRSPIASSFALRENTSQGTGRFANKRTIKRTIPAIRILVAFMATAMAFATFLGSGFRFMKVFIEGR